MSGHAGLQRAIARLDRSIPIAEVGHLWSATRRPPPTTSAMWGRPAEVAEAQTRARDRGCVKTLTRRSALEDFSRRAALRSSRTLHTRIISARGRQRPCLREWRSKRSKATPVFAQPGPKADTSIGRANSSAASCCAEKADVARPAKEIRKSTISV